MSGIDYRAVRAAVSMERVLQLLDYHPAHCRGSQLRGTCPLHDPQATGDARCFSAHLDRHFFRCFHCGAHGNQLDLWRLLHHLPLYHAALHLCHHAHISPTLIPPSAFPHRNSQPPTPH